MQLNLNSVSYTYPGASSPAIRTITATFPTGWTGLIGDNGCGKTTLALLAAGQLLPSTGAVSPKLFGAFCPQDSSVAPENLADFACDWGRDGQQIRRLLQIDDEWLWNFDHLSGGQKKRIQIACALWQRPDLLIMDEPTNDLDAPTRAIVKAALATFEGMGMLISHDRDLLDSLVRQCLVFENGEATMRPGGYRKASEQAAQERASQLHEHEQAKREAARLQREAQRRAEEAARSKGRLSAKGLAKGDSDKRERLGRAKVTGKDTIAGRASATMNRRLEQAEEATARLSVTKRYDAKIAAIGAPSRAKWVAHSEAGALVRGSCAEDAEVRFLPAPSTGVGRALDDAAHRKAFGAPSEALGSPTAPFSLVIPELWVGPTDHVGLAGQNGSGKSTLLSHLLGSVPPSVRCAFVGQSVSPQQREAALAQLRQLSAADAGQVLSLVARLNSDPDRLLDGRDTSPGEMRKLVLAQQLLQEPNLLVMDEPTNHLDVGSIEALQAMLAEFPGALLLVTHDQQLLEATCSTHWLIEEKDAGAYHLRIP